MMYITSDDVESLFVVGLVNSFDVLFIYLDLLTTRVNYVIIVIEVLILKPLIVYVLVRMSQRKWFSTLVETSCIVWTKYISPD